MTVFASAATAFATLVHRLPEDRWDGPGLGDWDLRALVGHTSRSLITVSTYVKAPADREDIDDAVEYYVRMRDYAADLGASDVLERGRQAGRDLGSDPAAAVDELVTRAVADVAAATRGGADPLIAVIGGLGITLSAYLHTRIFELVVHGRDIARATGIEFDVPADALTDATLLATRVALAIGEGATVLEALTGRSSLPAGFSVT